jgi:hypothetical protein
VDVRIIVCVVMCGLLSQSRVVAQMAPDSRAAQPIRASIARLDLSGVAVTNSDFSALQTTGRRERSVGRKIAGGVIGGVGGFFAGAYLGAAIDGDCGGCDDPGFKGFLIGAPIGAVVGAILGVKCL